jgi:hypothetical protein
MPDVPEGSVIITPAEIYAKVMTLTEAVQQMVAKEQASTLASDVSDLKVRVRALEMKVWMVAGAAAAMGSGLGTFLAKLLAG